MKACLLRAYALVPSDQSSRVANGAMAVFRSIPDSARSNVCVGAAMKV